MAIEIVDFPINSMVIFHCYVSSPEGMGIWPTVSLLGEKHVAKETNKEL